MRPNVFVAADSNHGYKMIAVGREIARVLTGEHSSLLHPFRFERFATGDLHPVSHSPYPWSHNGPRFARRPWGRSAGHPCPADRRKCPDGVPGGRGDGPLGIRASLSGPAAPHPTDAAAGGPVIRSSHAARIGDQQKREHPGGAK